MASFIFSLPLTHATLQHPSSSLGIAVRPCDDEHERKQENPPHPQPQPLRPGWV